MAQAGIEPGDPLYDLVATLDLSQVAPKLHCGRGDHFLLNAFKTACCDTAICEACNQQIETICPVCKHEPYISKPNKTLRNTARGYLKDKLAKTASASSATRSEPTESAATVAAESVVQAGEVAGNGGTDEDGQAGQDITLKASTQNDSVVLESQHDEGDDIDTQSQPRSRRNTLDSVSVNDAEDDIEILVGSNEDILPDPEHAHQFEEYEEDYGQQQEMQDGRTQSTSNPDFRHQHDQTSQPSNENQNNNNNNNNNGWGQNMANMNDMGGMGMGMGMGNFGNPNMMQMMMNMQQMMSMNGGNMTPDQFQMMSMMPNFQGMFGANGMPGGNQWYNSMMGQNGFNDFTNQVFANQNGGYGQGQQYQNNYGNNRQFSKRGGRFGRGRGGRGFQGGRGSFYNQQEYPYQNNAYDQGAFNSQYQQNSQSQFEGQSFADRINTNDKEPETTVDDDDFAPAGQDEVREALGDQYKKEETPPSAEPIPEQIREELADENLNQELEHMTQEPDIVASPKHSTPKPESANDDIPEAYREDIDFPMAPPTAPSGPSSKDYPYRNRGNHGRYPSRGGRSGYQSTNGHHPPSPARSLSQSQTQSPTSNKGVGVVGAPTGPKAMRPKEAPAQPATTRSNNDTGFRIMGRANMKKEDLDKEDRQCSPSPRRHRDDEHDDRSRDNSRRPSKYDSKYDSRQSSTRHTEPADDYDEDYNRRRKRSRRDDEYDYDMQDTRDQYPRSESLDRKDSYRSSRREREKTKDKYSSSSKYRSSRRYEEDEEMSQQDGYGETVDSKTHRSSKKSGKYDERDERREKEYERAEKDKHRKRSRHDREREEDYEDADEEESRRRSRKHRKEHPSSSRRDRDTEYEDTDLGLRISGRSTSHRNSEAATPTTAAAPAPDIDPHEGERERRNRERMAKEEQRRLAAKGLSGGRKVSYKYEDDIERSMAKMSRRR